MAELYRESIKESFAQFNTILNGVENLQPEHRRKAVEILTVEFGSFLEKTLSHGIFGDPNGAPYTISKQTSKVFSMNENLSKLLMSVVENGLMDEVALLELELRKPFGTHTPEEIREFSLDPIRLASERRAPKLRNLLVNLFTTKRASTSGDGDIRSDRTIPVALSILMYGRNRLANWFQGFMGYYLNAAKVGKRALADLNRLGICCSYSSLMIMMHSMAGLMNARFKSRVRTMTWSPCYDNVNKFMNYRSQMMNKSKFVSSETGVFVRILPVPDGGCRLGPADINHLAINDVVAEDIVPSDNSYRKTAARKHILDILCTTSKEISKLSRKMTSKPVISQEYVTPSASEAAEIYTLPLLDMNEASIDETIDILRAILNLALGEDSDKRELLNQLIMIFGDWLTARNITSALFLRQWETRTEDTFSFVVPVIGLFHLFMNVMACIVGNYFGQDGLKDVASLQTFMRLLGNNRIKAKGSMDVRATEEFLNTVLDAHVIALVLQKGSADSLKELAKLRTEDTLLELIDEIVDELYDYTNIQSKRRDERGTAIPLVPKAPRAQASANSATGSDRNKEPSRQRLNMQETLRRLMNDPGRVGDREPEVDPGSQEPTRDVVSENAWLFVRDMLVVRDFQHAKKKGDVDRLIKSIEYFCVMFHGSPSSKNYSVETMHLLVCLKKIWSPRTTKLWKDASIINIKGEHERNMFADEFCEYIVRELKEHMDESSNSHTSRFLHEVTAQQLMLMFQVRKQMRKTLGTTDYGDSHSKEDFKNEVEAVRLKLSERGVFKYIAGRVYSGGENDRTVAKEAVDLYGEGLRPIISGAAFQKYLKTKRNRTNWAGASGGEEMGDMEEMDNMVEMAFAARFDGV